MHAENFVDAIFLWINYNVQLWIFKKKKNKKETLDEMIKLVMKSVDLKNLCLRDTIFGSSTNVGPNCHSKNELRDCRRWIFILTRGRGGDEIKCIQVTILRKYVGTC